MRKIYIGVLLLTYLAFTSSTQLKKGHFIANKASEEITLDGSANEKSWRNAEWYPIDERWLGEAYTKEDFTGKFKVTWNEDYIYLFVEIVDDTVLDKYADPFKQFWDDDCVEIFIDEDQSKGEHTYSYNAFAYHVALDYNVVDTGTDKSPHLYNDHVQAKHVRKGKVSNWEISMKVFDDAYQDGKENRPVKLSKNKVVGFALAYCDGDVSPTRENFIGTIPVEGDDKNRGYIDAGIFGTLTLK